MRRTQNAFRIVAAAALLLLSIPGLTTAGSIPLSAVSHSLSIQPELADYLTLTYQFPERAVLEESQIWSSGSGGTSAEYGAGAIGRKGPAAFYFLMQRRPHEASMSGIYHAGGRTIYESGIGIGGENFRGGIAYRGSYKSTESHDHYTEHFYDEIRHVDRLRVERARVREASIGGGMKAGPVAVDLALDIWKSDGHADAVYLESDSSVYHAEMEGVQNWALAGRISAHLAEDVEIVAVGRWGRPEVRANGIAWEDTTYREFDWRRKRDQWYGGLSISFPTEFVDRLTISGMARIDEIAGPDLTYRDTEFKVSRSERFWIGASVEHCVIPELLLRAGVGAHYSRGVSFTEEQDVRYIEHHSESRSDGTDRSFQWGATYRWKNILLNGSASTGFELYRPFYVVDIAILL